MSRLLTAALLAAATATALPAAAFERITDRDTFVGLVDGKELTRFAVRLRLSAGGAIEGRAFGQEVRGEWSWRDGLFCRALRTASRSVPDDCQLVEQNGDTLRFTAQAGQGDSADLRLR